MVLIVKTACFLCIFVLCLYLALPIYPKTSVAESASPEIHMIYSIYSPGYLKLLEGTDWRTKTLGYLNKMWQQIRRDPNPALELVINELGAGGADGNAGKSLTYEQIVELAQGLEELGIQFYLFVAGPFPGPIVTVSTAEAVLKAAPTTCKGFYISETLNSSYGWNYWSELMALRNLGKKYGRKLIWSEHSRDGARGMGWWGYNLCNNAMWAEMFNERYADVIVPLHETNDPRVETINMGTSMGMWLGGLSAEWGFSVQDWWWHDAGYGPIESSPPKLAYRMMFEAASLGAVYFQFEHMQMIWEWGSWTLAPIYRTGIRPFIEQYVAGQIVIPDKTQVLSLSPVAIRLTEAQSRSAFSLLDSRPTKEETPQEYIPNYLYNEKKYVDGLIPETPYGILVVFPHNANPESLSWFKHIFETDGTGISTAEGYLPPGETKEMLLPMFVTGSSTLPLRVEGAYGAATRLDRGRYLIWLLDPAERPTGEVHATVELSFQEADSYTIYDRITGQSVGKIDNQEKKVITIDGARLLEVVCENASL